MENTYKIPPKPYRDYYVFYEIGAVNRIKVFNREVLATRNLQFGLVAEFETIAEAIHFAREKEFSFRFSLSHDMTKVLDCEELPVDAPLVMINELVNKLEDKYPELTISELRQMAKSIVGYDEGKVSFQNWTWDYRKSEYTFDETKLVPTKSDFCYSPSIRCGFYPCDRFVFSNFRTQDQREVIFTLIRNYHNLTMDQKEWILSHIGSPPIDSIQYPLWLKVTKELTDMHKA